MQGTLADLPVSPWIIVPVAPNNPEAAKQTAQRLQHYPDISVIEWRVDALINAVQHDAISAAQEGFNTQLHETAKALRKVNKPLLCTVRTEDPNVHINGNYADWVKAVMGINPDLLDIEISQDAASDLARNAHAQGIPVIASKHYFTQAPTETAVYTREFDALAKLGDVAKLAVSLTAPEQIEQFKKAAQLAARHHPTLAIVMGEAGRASRCEWAQWGNWATFASCGYASAPGQLTIREVLTSWQDAGIR